MCMYICRSQMGLQFASCPRVRIVTKYSTFPQNPAKGAASKAKWPRGSFAPLWPKLNDQLISVTAIATKLRLLAKGLGHEVVGRTHYTITIDVLNGSMVKKIRCSTSLAWQLFVGKTCICQSQRILFLYLGVSGLKKPQTLLLFSTRTENHLHKWNMYNKCAEICLECYLSS